MASPVFWTTEPGGVPYKVDQTGGLEDHVNSVLLETSNQAREWDWA